jgi:hypothetical protein
VFWAIVAASDKQARNIARCCLSNQERSEIVRYIQDIVLLLATMAEQEMTETDINRLRRVISTNRAEIERVHRQLVEQQHRQLADSVRGLLDSYGTAPLQQD